jgi:hypothetical protein
MQEMVNDIIRYASRKRFDKQIGRFIIRKQSELIATIRKKDRESGFIRNPYKQKLGNTRERSELQ